VSSPTNDVRYAWDLLLTLVIRDVKVRYRRSVLGLGWSLLNPLLQLLVFYFVFSKLLPLRIENYTMFLFVGLVAWTWFSSSLVAATSSIVDNGPLLLQPGFPESVLVVVSVASHLVNFLIALPIAFVFAIFAGRGGSWMLLSLPVVIAVQFLFTVSIAFLLAAVHVRFRDTQYLLGILLMLGFYLAPVFYRLDSIPEQYRAVYSLNPMVPLLESYRRVMLDGTAPEWKPLLLVAAGSAMLLFISYRFFLHRHSEFVEQL
jgi:lipopolysaccharide transport system permease protein